jgi:predicted nucleic acid-binding protein
MRELREAGQAIDVRDAMQAAICLEDDTLLVTRNARHFTRVPGLTVLSTDRALARWPA